MSSNKTITTKVRKAETPEKQAEYIKIWLEKWKIEQTTLTNKAEFAIEISDIDVMCKTCGALRAVNEKKFIALYNILRYIGLEKESISSGNCYKWGKYQTGIIAQLGRAIANNNQDKALECCGELTDINKNNFAFVDNLIQRHLFSKNKN